MPHGEKEMKRGVNRTESLTQVKDKGEAWAEWTSRQGATQRTHEMVIQSVCVKSKDTPHVDI